MVSSFIKTNLFIFFLAASLYSSEPTSPGRSGAFTLEEHPQTIIQEQQPVRLTERQRDKTSYDTCQLFLIAGVTYTAALICRPAETVGFTAAALVVSAYVAIIDNQYPL